MPGDPAWPLAAMGLGPRWPPARDGAGEVVAVVDGGVDGSHPAVRGRVRASIRVRAGDLAVVDVADEDRSGHGTGVASLVAGGEVAGVRIGAAPGVGLLSVDAVGDGGDDLARIVVGMDAAAARGASIVCLPLGTRSRSTVLAAAAAGLRTRGVLTVASAGNDGAGAIRSPADHGDVLSVGACDHDGRVTPTSGSLLTPGGRCLGPDVVAPGQDVRAAVGRGIGLVSGTSFATGYVAGLAAVLRQASPRRSVADVEAAIIATAGPLDDVDRVRSVRGTVDAVAARRALRPRAAPVPHDRRRQVVADLVRGVDPFLSALIRRSADRDVELSVVAVARPDGADGGVVAAVDAARRASGRRASVVLEQPWTGTTVVRGPVPLIAALAASGSLHVVGAGREDHSPPVRGAVVTPW